MDSPAAPSPAANNAATPSPTVVQDSPFFAYVSNLSPIRTVNDVRAPSAFRELNFPSPSPVFTSPHANPMQKENLLKRSEYLSPDSGKLCLDYSGSSRELPENTSVSVAVSVPLIMDSECEFPAQLQSCSSPSGSVDEFLADPMEDCVDSSGPVAQLHQQSHDRCINPDETSKEFAPSNCCCPSGCVNETLANQEERGKAADLADTFLASDRSLDEEIRSNISKKIMLNLNFHKDSMDEGGAKAEDRPKEDLLLGQTEDSEEGADEGYMNDDKTLNQCSESPYHYAKYLMKRDKCEEIAADVLGYLKSVDQDSTYESYAVPKSGECKAMDRREKKVTYPLDHPHYGKEHSAETEEVVELDFTPRMDAESVKILPLDSTQHGNSEASCNTSFENVISYERGGFPSKVQSDGSQHQRAMRKRLEFDSAGSSKMDPECSWKPCSVIGVVSKMGSNSDPFNLDNLNASHAESVAASDMQVSLSANHSEHALASSSSHLNQKAHARVHMVDRSVQNNESSSVIAPRPSGIGLHLNSIVNVVVMNCHINVQSEKDFEQDNLSGSGEMALCCSSHQRINDSEVCLASMMSTGIVSVKSAVDSYSVVHSVSRDGDQQGNLAMTLPSSSVSLESQVNMNPFKSSLQSKFLDRCMAPCNMKGPPSEDSCGSEELNELSPRKKRKKAPEDVGCKRCNCKKSKCLKLYCDCFAAGVYCAEACACQGCFNRPEYEDTVLETRQQIENRNPLAFAPKVVARVTEAPRTSGEDKKFINPTSARHKRGCNCKRSQCQKKYCECFQAKVGCSIGCRCEGCHNSYGKKEVVETIETEHIKAKDEGGYNPADGTGVGIRNEMLDNDKYLRCLPPFTPLLEGSNDGNVSKFQYGSRNLLSPESAASVPFANGKFQSSPTNSEKTGRLVKVRGGNSMKFPYRRELAVHDGDEIDFSPGWDRLAERCKLRLLPSSSSGDLREQTNSRQAPLSQGSGCLSVGSSLGHSSPITPVSWFGESRLSLESCSDSEPLKAYEDDTPDILKDGCVPDKGLKMSSPNKKRVSPPHKCLNEINPKSSASMRSRKFILKSVPSFPSLTHGTKIIGHET